MRFDRDSWYGWLVHLALLILAALTLLLVRENRELRGSARGAALAVGDAMADLRLVDLDGRSRPVDFRADRDTLLLVFTTTCPVCQDNQPSWKDLYERHSDRFRIVGISVDDAEATRRYVDQHGLPFPVVLPSDVEGFPRRHRIGMVPTTIRVAPGGEVESLWVGPLTAEHLAELDRA